MTAPFYRETNRKGDCGPQYASREDTLGRSVTVRGFDTAGHEVFKVFDVGLGPREMAITAVRIMHPDLSECHMQSNDCLSATAIAFMDLQPGEVRERHGVESLS